MNREVLRKGRLVIHTERSEKTSIKKGGIKLSLNSDRDVLVYVPQAYNEKERAPLALMLHGAGGNAEHGMHLLQHLANEKGIILVSPSSQGSTWDIIARDQFGSDVVLINAALTQVLETYAVDRSRLAIGGFSDGASYALSLGLINGDFFTHIIAFSPGFYYAPQAVGKPGIFISHGLRDDVLPIKQCSQRIVPVLKKERYSVEYREFDGPHIIPPAISLEAVQWLMGGEKLHG